MYFDYMTSQISAVHRTNTYIHQGLYNGIPEGQQNPWMTLDEFTQYAAWPGDRPHFQGEVEQAFLQLHQRIRMQTLIQILIEL